jgi:hypothetical protein
MAPHSGGGLSRLADPKVPRRGIPFVRTGSWERYTRGWYNQGSEEIFILDQLDRHRWRGGSGRTGVGEARDYQAVKRTILWVMRWSNTRQKFAAPRRGPFVSASVSSTAAFCGLSVSAATMPGSYQLLLRTIRPSPTRELTTTTALRFLMISSSAIGAQGSKVLQIQWRLRLDGATLARTAADRTLHPPTHLGL